jgi:hypothetical protein
MSVTDSSDTGCPVAHDDPERPLEFGVWLCCCQRCAVALHALAVTRPGAPIVLKAAMSRPVLPAIEAAFARSLGTFEDLLVDPRDYLREVFVGSGADFDIPRQCWPPLPPPSEWVPCAECADDAES